MALGTAKVELRGVKKRFGSKVVLDGIDLTLAPGQSLVVIGGSGTGKSVMIKCVLGILRPDEGQIFVDGEDVTRLRGRAREAYLRKFGMLFQGAALFDSLPVWENVAFALIQGRGMRRAKAKDIALEKLARVGLGPEVANLSPAELSGGMQKRVGLARAIAAEPEIIFFDEPTTGLDPIMADVINDLIVSTVKDLGVTALSITHDMVSARKISDRVAMLYKGKIIWDGPTQSIDASGNEYVDQFIHGKAVGPIQMELRKLMARGAPSFACQACGAVHAKWSGKCDACGGWNTIVEEGASAPIGAGSRRPARGRAFALEDLKTVEQAPPRRPTGVAEFDRVCGGGLVPGSALLIGGDPGIGKSTLILQALAEFAKRGGRAVYISGEEAMAQVRLRAARMGLSDAPVALGSATRVEDVLSTLEAGPPPGIVAIDSIQTIWTSALEAAPGTIAQVRTASFDLVRYAKSSGAAVLLVGHVTKEGQIAGPKQVEHLVDAVLYFEGERGHHFRILRAVKNRFGPTDEIGVFEMTGGGLVEVANPSALFLGDRSGDAPGTAVFAGLEGTRPLLVEIQALVAPAGYGTPRRAVVGWDSGRLAMILAVLEARAGLQIGSHDVYLNVAGGMKVTEPAADLAAAAALISSFTGQPLPRDCVLFGEISLSGDIRQAPQAEARLKEAAKLGFASAAVPVGTTAGPLGLALRQIGDVASLASFAGAARESGTRSRRAGVVE